MLNNYSPKQLSALIALFISLIATLVFLFFPKKEISFFIGTVMLFMISFLLIKYTLDKIIVQRIRIIYKLISRTKASKREEFFQKHIIPKQSIKEIETVVEKWAEQRNNEIESLRSLEIYRREFLQNFSHEIKTPIFAIQGYIDSINEGGISEELKKKFLLNAANNIDRMVLLMKDIDEIARLESGIQKLTYSLFVIQELIKEVFESLSILGKKKNIKYSIKRNCELPIIVFADKEKIRQVLINLISNAVRYGKENGNVFAGIYATDTEQILVEISDDGIGIAEEHLPRIFERFYRTDKARQRSNGGTGLGLAICKHIIEAHQQTIHARSTIDIGTTIGFTLAKK